jgi:hypothetical protein
VSSALTAFPGTDLAVVAPLQNALMSVLDDAIGWRAPQVYGCCTEDEMCGDHQADEDRARAMEALMKAMGEADGDGAVLALLAAATPEVLAEITGATADEDVIAAIEGGTGEEK